MMGDEEEENRYRDTPRGAPVEVVRVGVFMPPPPQRKMRTSWTLPQNVHTCCCRESMDTSRITTMDRTWTGESRTTPYGSVVVAG